jgi:Tol biopolymer transport system component
MAIVVLPAAGEPGTTAELISVTSAGIPGENESFQPVFSDDARFVAFTSDANDLVPGDTNNAEDVFVRDRMGASTERVSVSSSGAQSQMSRVSLEASISADGRYVAFASDANNLVSGNTHDLMPFREIYMRDRQASTTERVRVDSDGHEANDQSGVPAISADGHYVAFSSNASNLVPSDTNGAADTFVHDLQTGSMSRISVGSDGTQGNSWSGVGGAAISSNGRFVAFSSFADNLVPADSNLLPDVFVRDRQTGATELVSLSSTGAQQTGTGSSFEEIAISTDGRYVAFSSPYAGLVPDPLPPGGGPQVYLRDRLTQTTRLISISNTGAPGEGWDPAISSNGNVVSFVSGDWLAGIPFSGENVYARDWVAGITRLATLAPLDAHEASYGVRHSLSADGTAIGFNTRVGFIASDSNSRFDVYAAAIDHSPPDTLLSSGPTGTTASRDASFAFGASESLA